MRAMRALNKKLLRDLWKLRGQVMAVSVVIASGVAVLVMSLTTLQALKDTSALFYERYQFADVFAGLKRAPNRLHHRLEAIPGVQFVETRVSKFAVLDVAGFDEPLTGRIVGIRAGEGPRLNRPKLRSGRFLPPGRIDEVIVSEMFAEAQGLELGTTFWAIMDGSKRKLTVVGTGVSPEFVYAIAPGSLMPDDKRFGILWMDNKALSAAYNLDGAFNDVALTLLHGVTPESVIPRVDVLLSRYGGTGAIARKDQISNWFLMNEIEELKTLATILPTIFLFVSGLLTHAVLTRLVATERSEIGLLKAFGYSDIEVGWHYAKLVVTLAGLGTVLGWMVGSVLGRYNTEIYARLYNLPDLYFQPGAFPYALSAVISIVVALAGALQAVRGATTLSPAAAMRPPEPTAFRRSGILDYILGRWVDHSTKILLRQISRWPLRAAFSCIGFALATGLLITALQWKDAIGAIADSFFFKAQRQTMMVALSEASSETAEFDFRHLPGVLAVEPGRFVSVRLRKGSNTHRGSIEGVRGGATLKPIFDIRSGDVPVPPDGLLLSRELAEKLGAKVGETVTVEVLEGRRSTFRIPVVRITNTYIGMNAYMELGRLNRYLKEPPSLEHVSLLVDPRHEGELFLALKKIPEVSMVMLRRASVQKFDETLGDTVMVFIRFYTAFSCALAFGVVYNAARIALSERGRELATLRVLGYTRAEISYILLGEIGLLVVAGLPLGVLLGWGLSSLIGEAFATELFRVPTILVAETVGIALIIMLISAVVSGGLVRRRVDNLDLISVLKTRE